MRARYWPWVVALALLGAPALAQNWPVKPVRFICAQGPGIPNDLALRWVAERLSKSMGRTFFVDNVVGAGGVIAAQTTARSAPDGYTFLMEGIGNVATDRYMYRSLPYDPEKDFVPVAMIFDTAAYLVAAHRDVPAKTLAELIALAKAQPGKLSYGADTIGTAGLLGPWFNRLAGTDIVGVNYKSGAQLIQDFVAGRTQVVFYSIALLRPYEEAGKVRALAVTSDKRYPSMPDLPTVAETLPGYRIGGMGLLAAPTGTPAEVIQRLNREVDPIVRDPEYLTRLASFGFGNTDGARTVKQLEEVVGTERAQWARVFKELNFQPQ